MSKKKDPRIFESITDKQKNFIHVLCNESIDFDQDEFDSQLILLNGFPSLDGLSKQEASLIIDRLLGKKKAEDTPYYPKKESALGEDARLMPTANQIKGMRESIKSLGWGEESFKTWLKKRTGSGSIGALDRKTAQNALGALMKLRTLQYTI